MNWATVRNKFPGQWVLLEAIEVHSTDGKRIVDRVSVINTYDEGKKALQEYKLIHKKEPNRELYVAHTSKTKKNIQSTHDPT